MGFWWPVKRVLVMIVFKLNLSPSVAGVYAACLACISPMLLAVREIISNINWAPAMPRPMGLYFNCKTLLVERIRACYEDLFLYAGNRCVWVSVEPTFPSEVIAHSAEMTLLYHVNRRAEAIIERRQG
jgi:hypothetical protein